MLTEFKPLKYTTEFEDGNLSELKTSNLFPDSWLEKSIIETINKVGNTKPIG